MSSSKSSKQNEDQARLEEKAKQRKKAVVQPDRPESDGEDFNQGARSRNRPEATGEDF